MSRKTKPIHAFIDADILIYHACAAVEKATHWGDDMWTLHADAREAKCMLDIAVQEIKDNLKTNRITLCLSSPNNFRMTILSSYKANRATTRKPVCFTGVRQYARQTYASAEYARLEGDDVVGILATRPNKNEMAVMVSEDKDFKTLPGEHYNPRTGFRFTVTPQQAIRNHFIQTLTGDTTDNYKGCPGVGPVKAEKIIGTDVVPSWDAVLAAFLDAGLTAEDALTQARVAHILQHGEYDFGTGEIKQWNP